MFKVGTFLFSERAGSGAFSTVVKGVDCVTGETVVAKLERTQLSQTLSCSLIVEEVNVLEALSEVRGVPRLLHFGDAGDYRVAVLSYHGTNLEVLQQNTPSMFTHGVCIDIFVYVMRILEQIHAYGFIHGDVKPENILSDPVSGLHHLVLCDFGLAKYWQQSNGKHVPQKDRERKTGSPRYMSPNTQGGLGNSRRDDLLSLYYSVLYLMLGTLPWSDSGNKRKDEDIVNEKRRLLMHADMKFVPSGFRDAYVELSALGFSELPNYFQLESIMRST